jgi:3-hydroxyisobutyrate dehydrogenase-like beta-hydroxyacid dehydrogenase
VGGRAGRTPLPLGAAAQQLYALMSAQGRGQLDFSGVFTLLQQQQQQQQQRRG